ncbi:MAG: hypothetical protein ACX939_04285 [Hyphococcus sp.]
MQAFIWLILLVLAAIGVAAIVDYTGAYDVPMIEVEKQADAAE